MPIIDRFLAEFEHEAATTRKLLERAPEDHYDWKPHPKSMSLRELCSHLAEIPVWVPFIFSADEFEVDPKTYRPFAAESRSDLLEKFDSNVKQVRETLGAQPDGVLQATWRFKAKGQVVFEFPRLAVLHNFILKHLVHHRGQLSVYLRLKDIPIPSIYGPSADEAA